MLRMRNACINSPSMKELATSSVDGRSVLKSEIADSNYRLRKIKHGMAIKQVIERYTNQPHERSLPEISMLSSER
jgi:hypothetical protein